MGGTHMVENKNLNELRDELEQAKQEKLQAEHQLQRKKNQLSYREILTLSKQVRIAGCSRS